LTAHDRELVLASILESLPDEVVVNADIFVHHARRTGHRVGR
jgi:hypothetical protein